MNKIFAPHDRYIPKGEFMERFGWVVLAAPKTLSRISPMLIKTVSPETGKDEESAIAFAKSKFKGNVASHNFVGFEVVRDKEITKRNLRSALERLGTPPASAEEWYRFIFKTIREAERRQFGT